MTNFSRILTGINT